jgi:hypothetical protein
MAILSLFQGLILKDLPTELEILLSFVAGAKVAMIALTLDCDGQTEVLDLMTVTAKSTLPSLHV